MDKSKEALIGAYKEAYVQASLHGVYKDFGNAYFGKVDFSGLEVKVARELQRQRPGLTPEVVEEYVDKVKKHIEGWDRLKEGMELFPNTQEKLDEATIAECDDEVDRRILVMYIYSTEAQKEAYIQASLYYACKKFGDDNYADVNIDGLEVEVVRKLHEQRPDVTPDEIGEYIVKVRKHIKEWDKLREGVELFPDFWKNLDEKFIPECNKEVDRRKLVMKIYNDLI